jgi:hypothetical protein
MSKFIGVIRGVASGHIYAVINPDSDAELDNERLLLMRGPGDELVMMVKVPRGEYTKAMTPEQLTELVERIKS